MPRTSSPWPTCWPARFPRSDGRTFLGNRLSTRTEDGGYRIFRAAGWFPGIHGNTCAGILILRLPGLAQSGPNGKAGSIPVGKSASACNPCRTSRLAAGAERYEITQSGCFIRKMSRKSSAAMVKPVIRLFPSLEKISMGNRAEAQMKWSLASGARRISPYLG